MVLRKSFLFRLLFLLFLENSLTDHDPGSIVCVSSVPHEVIHLIQNKDKKESNLGMEGVMKDKVLLQYFGWLWQPLVPHLFSFYWQGWPGI